VDPLQQRLEIQAAAVRVGNDDFPVDNRSLGQTRLHSRDYLGEVPGHRPLVPAADLDLVKITEDDRPEAVPLRFVAHRAAGYGRNGLREHGRDRRHHGKIHETHLAL
jgi:hypothetical protein